jgi:hypothetical protein
MNRGTVFILFLKGIEYQGKPCPGEKNREQGFSGGTTPRTATSIKDTKKYFKEKFFMGQ